MESTIFSVASPSVTVNVSETLEPSSVDVAVTVISVVPLAPSTGVRLTSPSTIAAVKTLGF